MAAASYAANIGAAVKDKATTGAVLRTAELTPNRLPARHAFRHSICWPPSRRLQTMFPCIPTVLDTIVGQWPPPYSIRRRCQHLPKAGTDRVAEDQMELGPATLMPFLTRQLSLMIQL
jgi:hypothetical protein